MRCSLLLLCLVMEYDSALSARVLAVFPLSAKSHHILFQAVLRSLAERGHEVVSYMPILQDKPTANYTEILLDNIPPTDKSMTKEQLDEIMNMSPLFPALMLQIYVTGNFTEYIIQNNKIQQLITSADHHFDVIILEALFGQEILLGFAHKFKAPVICLQPFGTFSIVNKVSGNPLSLAYIPDYSLPFPLPMSFYHRLLNTISILTPLLSYYFWYLPKVDMQMQELFKDPSMPPLEHLLQNISLFVHNGHPYVHYAQPHTPNLIPIGGIHLAKERKPLPTAMKKFLDEAAHGVIFFSMGSIVPDNFLPQQFFDNFIRVFRRLPQRVLWKTGSEHKELPSNVFTAPWVPQQDVLAHPNVVLFITHGGLFSQHETIHAGVPVVCIPYFGDQPMNARFYEERGVGIQLLFKDLSEETIHLAVTTILNNHKYKENMDQLSSIYRDWPVSPRDSLVYWVEYVLRHRGAAHLRPASATLPWYQLNLLDVLAVILAGVFGVITVLYLLARKMFCLLRGKKHAPLTKKTN